MVNGHRDHAVVRTDGTVAAGLEWLRRARLVVGLGETFDDGRLQASLDGVPVVITLTLMRACDEIVAVELCGRSLWARS